MTKVLIEMFNVIFSICRRKFNDEFLVLMNHHHVTQI